MDTEITAFDRETILVDYEVTESSMHTVFEKQKVMLKEKYGIDVPHCVFSSERFQMEIAIDYLEKEWGDAGKYLVDAAVSEEDIRIVKSSMAIGIGGDMAQVISERKGVVAMSYDLMVFERTKAPATKKEFMAWFEKQTEWGEEHDYETVSVASLALQNWFMEMIEKFPPMNGEYAPDPDSLDEEEAEDLERHMVDYSIGYDVIYAAFSWSVAEEAYELMRTLAQKHKVGFFDVSADAGDIILPDGTMIE